MSNTVPDGWQIKKLGSLVDPRSSNVDKKTDPGEIPVRLCNYTDVYYKNRITSDIDFMEASAKQREIDRFSLEKGDVIITKDSETPGDIAVPAYVSEDLNNVVCGYHLTLLKPHMAESDGEFLSHLFQLPSVQHYFYVLANGITRFGLTADAISEAPLLTPPLPEQQKIAAILSSVDDVIEKTRAQIDKLKDLKTGMMQELLTKGIGSGGVPHTEFKDSPVGRIPAGWNTELLDKVAARGSGHTPSKSKPEYWNGGIDWVSLSDTSKLDRLYINATAKQVSELGIQNSSAIIHPLGTVVLSRDAGIGKSAITTKEMAVSQHFIAWRCSNRLDNHFLYYLLQFWKPKFESIAMGSTIKTIGLPFFKQLHVPIPPMSEQEAITGALKSTDLLIFAAERRLDATVAVKKGLMQDLLTGKVRVKLGEQESAVA
jgi:Restriction endonuclease S subunits